MYGFLKNATYVSLPQTMTLFFVLFICASNGTSWNWLMAFAAPESRPVPAMLRAKVVHSNGAGATAYPAMVVTTTNTVTIHLFLILRWWDVHIKQVVMAVNLPVR